jgi:hypothetical protein
MPTHRINVGFGVWLKHTSKIDVAKFATDGMIAP